MTNLVQLVADMRHNEEFGQNFGISVTLAPDIWYLQHFDAKGLLQHVDWLGFMSYDLHGIWDANLPQLGKKVFGQTDIHDIEIDAMPLWYGLVPSDMARVNFGLALYGRGYTLADSGCTKADGSCLWTKGSKPAPCSAEEGIMSLTEIQEVISRNGLIPTALDSGHGKSMMKQITWDDQWIGYDDDETIKMKTDYASSHCFGGTMAWSIDMDSRPKSADDSGSVDGNPFTIKNPGASCSWSSMWYVQRFRTVHSKSDNAVVVGQRSMPMIPNHAPMGVSAFKPNLMTLARRK